MPEPFWIPSASAVGPTTAKRIRRFILFSGKLVFWLLVLLTLLALTLHLGAWRKEFKFAGPFAAETNAARHSLILAVPQEGRAEWWRQPLLGDDSGNTSRSFLELWIGNRNMGPPHSEHEAIRDGRTAGFSHWGRNLIFSLPPDVRNVPDTVATLRYNIRPRAWVTLALTVSSALLGWLLNRRAIGTFLSSHQGAMYFVEPGHRRKRAQIIGGLLFVAFLALAFQLRQRDIEFLVEPDFAWQTIEMWRNFFSTLDPAILPKPRPYVYLDGQFIAYGLTDAVLRWIVDKLVLLRPTFPNDTSYALGAALLTNIVAYATASTIVFFSIFRLTRNLAIAAVTALGFFLAPQMIEINIARVDFLNTLPISVIFYCSCVLAISQERKRHAVALGAAMAFAASLKINGLFFGVIPACAALAAFKTRKFGHLALFVVISLATFSLVYFSLMGRFIYYLTPGEIIQHYLDTMELVRPWGALMVQSPLYYNIGLMMNHGVAFIILYLFCAVATIVIAIRRGSGASIFLSLCFVVLCAGGMASIKYSHAGYHLLPVFFSITAFAASEILRSPWNRLSKISIVAIGAAVFATGLIKTVVIYSAVVAQRRVEVIALQALKREPRVWLVSHFPPGTRICVQTDSTWSLPELDGFVPIDGPLALPYLDPKALSHAAPPNLDEARRYCRLVVTSDYHRTRLGDLLRRASPENAAKWSRFFDTLSEKFPPVVFSSPVAIYSKEIYINDWGVQ